MERTILDHFPNGILIYCDRDLRYLRVGGEELARTGRSAADMEGKTIWEAYPPSVAAEIEPFHRRVLAGESVSYEARLRGRAYFVQGTPVWERGEVVGAVFSTQETTELRTKLGELGEQHRILFEHLPGAVVALLDTELRYLEVSRSLEQSGWSGPTPVGRSAHDLFAERPETLALFEAALAGKPQSSDYTSLDEQREYWLQVVPLVRDGAVFGVMSIAQDVTERKRLERELAEQRRAESLGVLAGGVAHDFNNLLQGIMGHTALALADLPESSPVRARLTQAQAAAEHAAALAAQMLAYSGARGLELKPIDLSELAADAFRNLPPALSSLADVTWRLTEPLPPTLADEAQLAEVPRRLIENAIESQGSVTISTGLDGNHVYLEIADDGEGMDAGVQERMFEPFFSTRFVGRGLGLAAVQGIVRGHGGSIDVRSERGVGTVVRVALPVAA